MEVKESMDTGASRTSIAEPQSAQARRMGLIDARKGAFALYVVAVVLLLLLPLSRVIAWFTGLVHLPESAGIDKYVHVALFAGLTFLYRWSSRSDWSWSWAARVLLVALLFGATIELVQGWSGYRSAEWTDLACDGVGAVVGLIASAVVFRGGR